MSSNPHFAIALSFPGEHRQFVQKIASRLAESEKLSRNLIFYDKWHQASLFGVKLDEKLAEIYADNTDLIVPFFSEHYSKRWCGIEWDSIRPLLLDRQRKNSVLPIHMDGTVIPGWSDTGLGIRRGRLTSVQVADLILEKYLDKQWHSTSAQSISKTKIPSVFISHHQSDLTFAKSVKARLAELRDQNGAPVCVPWLADEDIDIGDEYRVMIDDALRKAGAVVVILSPESCESKYVTYEWAYALGEGIPVIPVLLRPEGKVHPRLEVIQHLKFDKPADQPWERLATAVSRKVLDTKQMAIKPVEIDLLKKEIRSEVAKENTAQRKTPVVAALHRNIDTLLVIDVQRDFFSRGALPVPNAESLIAPLNRAIAAAQVAGMKVIFARDWHPATHKSFVNMSPTGSWPRHCVQDSIGAAFHPKLKLPNDAKIIDIGIDNSRLGYSAFEDDELARVMQSPEAGTLYIAGIALEYCVQATALEAVGKYNKPVVILDELVRATTTNRIELAPLWRELEHEGVVRHAGKAPFLAPVKSPSSDRDN